MRKKANRSFVFLPLLFRDKFTVQTLFQQNNDMFLINSLNKYEDDSSLLKDFINAFLINFDYFSFSFSLLIKLKNKL